jgi:hypothetical protein
LGRQNINLVYLEVVCIVVVIVVYDVRFEVLIINDRRVVSILALDVVVALC